MPSGPCMVKDHRPPFLNSQTLKVLVNPAGPHHRDKRSGSLIAAKTCSTVAGISRDVLNVVIGLSALTVFNWLNQYWLNSTEQDVYTASHFAISVAEMRKFAAHYLRPVAVIQQTRFMDSALVNFFRIKVGIFNNAKPISKRVFQRGNFYALTDISYCLN